MTSLIHVDAAWKSLFHYGEELCGDRVMIRRSDTSFVMVLADGLGSGVKANILSTLTSTIISQMIFDGLPLSEAVETIAATLPVCADREVAYSTFTILQVDYTGKARLVQYDNPGAVLIRSGCVKPLDNKEVVISDKKILEAEFDVMPDDHIIFFSDGILYADTEMQLNYNWAQKDVEEFLAASVQPEDSARECARILLAMVNSLYDGKPSDDCTVAAARIIPARETVVMIGPPKNKEDDKTVISRLMKATGKKIVCGGTTSKIVASYLHEEIREDTETPLGDVPPKAYIRGVDLVTEGLLTLQKVSLLLKHACQDPEFYEDLLLSKEEDGATCLVQALADSSAVTFLAGQSDNEGHHNLGSSISLDAKQLVIREIASYLETLGKITSIEEK
ncbi:MAG: serine/threonine-protein phosphatase [Solobacterium sp.]|nr:serine/threonine-protein phosphatase [Solobacterium sp.]